MEGVVSPAGVLEWNVLIRQRVVRKPNSCPVVTSPDSASGTKATLRTSRPFEPDETLAKPTELSFETCRDITPVQCRSAPSQPKRAKVDNYDGTILRHVSHECRNPIPQITTVKAVASSSSQHLSIKQTNKLPNLRVANLVKQHIVQNETDNCPNRQGGEGEESEGSLP